MSRVYVSIGSNIDQRRNIRSCITELQRHFGELLLSRVYENKAVGFEGDNFYNLVAGFDTDLDVRQVAAVLREIEESHGRVRGVEKFSSRTLDVDMLIYDDLVVNEKGLEIPRGEITRYAFVLKPLAEIDPYRIHPVMEKSFSQLWNEMDSDEEMWEITL